MQAMEERGRSVTGRVTLKIEDGRVVSVDTERRTRVRRSTE